MILDLENFLSLTKTKSEESTVIKGLNFSRSALGIECQNVKKYVFGFGASLNQHESIVKSQYELLEHAVFLADLHSDDSVKLNPVYHDGLCDYSNLELKSLLIGEKGFRGHYTANGCAISSNIDSAINHSRRELLERDICCQIWYNRSLPLVPTESINFDLIDETVKFSFYTSSYIGKDYTFGLVSLECEDRGFFSIGAAVRETLESSLIHAAFESAMVFEDMKKERNGTPLKTNSQIGIISLRDKKYSERRKSYIDGLVDYPPSAPIKSNSDCEVVCFEPLPGIFAARSFSNTWLDPREFHDVTHIPTLPLF